MRTRPAAHTTLAVIGVALSGAIFTAIPARAAVISEVYFDSPAGPAIELDLVDGSLGVTLAILDGSRHNANGLGKVLDVVHLQPGQGFGPLVLLSDNPWPGGTVPTTSVGDHNAAIGATTLNLGLSFHDRILVVFDGISTIQVNDQPRTPGLTQDRFNALAVTDWLAFGEAGLAQAYDDQYSDEALADINDALGIDLLARVADRSAGEVFARAMTSENSLDLETTYVGTPDDTGRFAVAGGLTYRTTPGQSNVPVAGPIPEPGTGAAVALGAWLVGRRRRRVVS